ncbi:MAG: hypothetical protein ACXW5U_21560 [Thermoanaerobaculia bacterium]
MATAKSTGGKKDDDAVSDMGGMTKEKKKQKDRASDGKKSK